MSGCLDRIYLPDPVNVNHPLNKGKVGWWLSLGGIDCGPQFWDLYGLNPGTLTGYGSTVAWQAKSRPGSLGRCIYSNGGSGTTCTIPVGQGPVNSVGLSTSTGWTISGWGCAVAMSGGYDQLVSWNETSGSYYISICLTGSYVPKIVSNGETGGQSSSSVTPGVWYHYALTFRGTSLILYRNGVIDYSMTPSTTNWKSSNNFQISGSKVQNSWDGYLDDICVYNRALSDKEMYELYNEGRIGYPDLLNRVSNRKLVTFSFTQTAEKKTFITSARVSKPNPGVSIDRSHPLSQNLVAMWVFNEGSGLPTETISQESATANLAPWVPSPTGASLSFDGSSQYVTVPWTSNLHINGPFSITTLANPSTATVGQFVVDFRSTSYNGGYLLGFNYYGNEEVLAGTITGGTSNNITSNSGVVDGGWHMWGISLSTDSTNGFQLYRDGIGIGQGTIPYPSLDLSTTPKIGARQDGALKYYNGQVSLIAIWNRGLSAQEHADFASNPWQVFLPAFKHIQGGNIVVSTSNFGGGNLQSGVVFYYAY